MYYKKIEGENLYLSPMCVEDAPKYVKWMNDFKVTDGLDNSKKVITLENEREWIEKNNMEGNYHFAIIKKVEDKIIGVCGFNKLEHINGNGTVGIFIGDEVNRGIGYGEEALNLLIGYGFDYLNLNNIMLSVFSFNESAIACYKKVGFKEIGRRREVHFRKNKRYDEIYMDILRSEYYSKINE